MERVFLENETILYDTTMEDTCHYAFVQITKSEPSCKLWILGDCNVSM